MKIALIHQPGNAAAKISLEPSEHITAEAGAMIAMSGDMGVTTTTHKKTSGSILKAAKRLLTGESFFLNHFTAGNNGGELYLAAKLPGDMMIYDLNGEGLIVQGGSFVGAANSVDLDLSWQGLKSFFSGERIFWIQMTGKGPLILSSFGAIYSVPVNGETIVDTGHVVAFSETLSFSLTKAGQSWVSSFLGGEGIVLKFKGRGMVWCQSHNPISFGRKFGRMLKPRR